MNKLIIITTILLASTIATYAQNSEYNKYVNEADEWYQKKEYRKAAEAFSKAFAANGNKGAVNDRYNAACNWSLASVPDSAFYQLFRLATKVSYANVSQLNGDRDLDNIRADKRWDELMTLVKQNKEKAEANLDKPLVALLDTIMDDDQKYRREIDVVEEKFGRNSKEANEVAMKMGQMDSINVIKVITILDKHGWLGADKVGANGNTTLFLVIQHADIQVQEKYLPMMRDAVKKGNAQPSSLALLEDRVALRQGRKQIYGSQISWFENGQYYIQPLEDPDNVDKRRSEVGLSPLNDYTDHWHFKWDPVAYKKQLPEIEKYEAERRKKLSSK